MKSNIEMIQTVSSALGELKEKCVFVGGATTSLYINDKAAPEPTASVDVDCVVEIDFPYSKFEKQLREKGFKDHDPTEEDDKVPICRKYFLGMKVDFMPPDKKALGFTNKWYKSGLKTKIKTVLPNKSEIYIFDLPHFLASKLEAFNARGKHDPLFSQDLEDLAQVLDGCTDLKNKLKKASGPTMEYLKEEFKSWLEEWDIFQEAIGAYLPYEGVKSQRVDRIKKILIEFAT
jgi:hypothetical protein